MKRATLPSIAFLLLVSQPVAGLEIERVVVKPTDAITSIDTISLEVRIFTGYSPPYFTEPTEVTVLGNEVVVDLYVWVGDNCMPDSTFVDVDLGTLPPGQYDFRIVMHHPWNITGQTVGGSFCVEHAQTGKSFGPPFFGRTVQRLNWDVSPCTPWGPATAAPMA